MAMTPPNKQVVLITGTSSGIGRLAAETLAARGHTVYASMRNASSTNGGAAEALKNRGARVIELDVTSTESVNRAAGTCLKKPGDWMCW